MTSMPEPIYLSNYTAPAYLIESVDLYFDLGEEFTTVSSQMQMIKNDNAPAKKVPLVLDGKDLILKSIAIDGVELTVADYQVTADHLIIHSVPDNFLLEIQTQITPQLNTALTGLYQLKDIFCTQCEAEGFRHITYFLDRPDVLTRFTTTIHADKKRYPVLLSNGNLVAAGEAPDNRHWVKWQDPFKKPCYLFALVAGNLEVVEDNFITKSARNVQLKIFVEQGNQDKCQQAMRSLKNAMRWDEQVFGLECDLDIFMIVAVSDFNMGAMENKGLNIFNAKYILANPETATDMDYLAIESVVGHEYFHNWSGNRVTCRDWFQLSLKEGLTIFRDQEFSADMNSRGVERIQNVRALRCRQFAEDAGPLAHPVRPEFYIEINNFYTMTVYNKGAEVIRMMQTLLGKEKFLQGIKLYFKRHDGQAVTTDDFVQAMEDASGIDLKQFRLWYQQAGTPRLTLNTEYDAAAQIFTLTVEQTCPPTPGQSNKQPLHIPLAIGLLNKAGEEIELQLAGEAANKEITHVLSIKKPREQFRFVNVPEQPVPSLLRNFSAPVIVKSDLTEQDLEFLLQYDSDAFNQWEAGQQIACKVLINLINNHQKNEKMQLAQGFIKIFEKLLTQGTADKMLLAELLVLPDESYLAELQTPVNVVATHEAREFVRRELAQQLRTDFLAVYHENSEHEGYSVEPQAIARRSLKNIALNYLMTIADTMLLKLCMQQFQNANNMTDSISVLKALNDVDCNERTMALEIFYNKWRHDALVIDKWFAIQATSALPNTLKQVQRLLQHPTFDIKNPNKVRALIGAFCQSNPIRFHEADGSGYKFLSEQVLLLNSINPQIAARLLEPLTHWKRYDTLRQGLMKAQLVKIQDQPGLSRDVYEIVSKSLVAA